MAENVERWKTDWYCRSCKRSVTVYTVVCPFCGFNSYPTTQLRARRFVCTSKPKWWEFWKKEKGYWEYKE